MLTNFNIYNAVGGRVTIGLNLGYPELTLQGLGQTGLQVFLRGDLEILGQSLAQVSGVMDFADPFSPSFNIAAGIPGSGGLLSLLLPGQARIGMQIDSDGLNAGLLIAVRTFVESVIEGGIEMMETALDRLADDYEQERKDYIAEKQEVQAEIARVQRMMAQFNDAGQAVWQAQIDAAQWKLDRLTGETRFFKTLLDLNRDLELQEGGTGDELGSDSDNVITGQFLIDRLLGNPTLGIPALLPTIVAIGDPDFADDLEQVSMGTMAAGRIMMDLLQRGVTQEEFSQSLDVLLDQAAGGIAPLRDLLVQLKDFGLQSMSDGIDQHYQNLLDLIPSDYDRDPDAPDERQLLVDALNAAKLQAENSARMAAALAVVSFSTLGSAVDDATNAFFDTINPSFTIEGHIQPVILGFPLGEPSERVRLRIDRHQVDLELKVRLLEKLQKAYLSFLPYPVALTDVSEVNIRVPFTNLYKDVFLGRIPEIDFAAPSPWHVGLESSLEIYGIEVAQTSGYVFPGRFEDAEGNETSGAEYLLHEEEKFQVGTERIDPNKIFVDASEPEGRRPIELGKDHRTGAH